jgi:hypothetical protein
MEKWPRQEGTQHLPPRWRRTKAINLSATQGRDFFGRCALTSKTRHSLSLSLWQSLAALHVSRCFGLLAHPACICEWACVCAWWPKERKSNLQQLPTHVSLSTLFKLGEKPQAMLLSPSLSHSAWSPTLWEKTEWQEKDGWVTGQRSAHGRRGSNFPLRAQPPKLTIYTLHTRLISFWAYAPRSLSLYTHQKKTQRSRVKRERPKKIGQWSRPGSIGIKAFDGRPRPAATDFFWLASVTDEMKYGIRICCRNYLWVAVRKADQSVHFWK